MHKRGSSGGESSSSADATTQKPQHIAYITVHHDSWSEIDMYVPRVNMSSPVLPCYFRNTKRKIQSKQLANDVNVQKQLDLEVLTNYLKMFI